MEIINKKIDELIPYENNPRKNDDAVEYVAKSIKEFGFKVPIVIDKNNVIVAGHTRYKASKQLGLIEVPCIVADDLTDEQVKAFRLADNKVSEYSNFDYFELQEELKLILEKTQIEEIKKFDFSIDEEIKWEETDETEKTSSKGNDFLYYECPNCHKLIEKEEILIYGNKEY